jgi:K+/H+ antiporter YhaU regulatory subunit KhtT
VDIATRSSQFALRIEQATVPEGSRLAPQETGLIVIAIGKPTDGAPDFRFNPSAETRIEAGDEVIVLGGGDQIEKLRTYVSKR